MQEEYGAFAQHFVTDFAPEIFKVYIHQVELFVSGHVWLSKKAQYHIFQFFTEWWVPYYILPYFSPSCHLPQCQAKINLAVIEATLRVSGLFLCVPSDVVYTGQAGALGDRSC
jgi:hypothetical protein